MLTAVVMLLWLGASVYWLVEGLKGPVGEPRWYRVYLIVLGAFSLALWAWVNLR